MHSRVKKHQQHAHTKHLTQIYATPHILKMLPMSISHMQPETWLVPTKLQARDYKKKINFYTNSLSLISLMVSVDVKHHDYLLTWTASIMSYFPMSSHNYKLTPFFIKYNLLCRGFIFSSVVFRIVYYAGTLEVCKIIIMQGNSEVCKVQYTIYYAGDF